jgi:hypothetical protein
MDLHEAKVHTWGEVLDYFDVSCDIACERNPLYTGDLTICSDAMAQILAAAKFGKFICGTCAVGIAYRCASQYMDSAPHAITSDYADVVFCMWALKQFDPEYVPTKSLIKKIPATDFPDIVNKTEGLVENHRHTLGKFLKTFLPYIRITNLVFSALCSFFLAQLLAGIYDAFDALLSIRAKKDYLVALREIIKQAEGVIARASPDRVYSRKYHTS